jgi:hypothetical protein
MARAQIRIKMGRSAEPAGVIDVGFVGLLVMQRHSAGGKYGRDHPQSASAVPEPCDPSSRYWRGRPAERTIIS